MTISDLRIAYERSMRFWCRQAIPFRAFAIWPSTIVIATALGLAQLASATCPPTNPCCPDNPCLTQGKCCRLTATGYECVTKCNGECCDDEECCANGACGSCGECQTCKKGFCDQVCDTSCASCDPCLCEECCGETCCAGVCCAGECCDDHDPRTQDVCMEGSCVSFPQPASCKWWPDENRECVAYPCEGSCPDTCSGTITVVHGTYTCFGTTCAPCRPRVCNCEDPDDPYRLVLVKSTTYQCACVLGHCGSGGSVIDQDVVYECACECW